ncbi:carbohydrate-binding family 9-like protein [Niabella aquatica]
MCSGFSGDGYDKPHYLSWTKIDSEYPDFHRPEYFRIFNLIF